MSLIRGLEDKTPGEEKDLSSIRGLEDKTPGRGERFVFNKGS
jgi:hypothetical protein